MSTCRAHKTILPLSLVPVYQRVECLQHVPHNLVSSMDLQGSPGVHKMKRKNEYCDFK